MSSRFRCTSNRVCFLVIAVAITVLILNKLKRVSEETIPVAGQTVDVWQDSAYTPFRKCIPPSAYLPSLYSLSSTYSLPYT